MPVLFVFRVNRQNSRSPSSSSGRGSFTLKLDRSAFKVLSTNSSSTENRAVGISNGLAGSGYSNLLLESTRFQIWQSNPRCAVLGRGGGEFVPFDEVFFVKMLSDSSNSFKISAASSTTCASRSAWLSCQLSMT